MVETFFSPDRPRPTPTDWEVACPTCGEQIAHEMDEETDGSFTKTDRDGDPVVNCECGCFFIPASIRIEVSHDA